MNSRQYKYFAFISYNSHDTKWGKRLQRKLENYRMPSTLCSERGWKRKPISPVFLLLPIFNRVGLQKNCKIDCAFRATLLSSVRLILCVRNGWGVKLSFSVAWVAPNISIFLLSMVFRTVPTPIRSVSTLLSMSLACLKFLEQTFMRRFFACRG